MSAESEETKSNIIEEWTYHKRGPRFLEDFTERR
jgi:hypothetical protein